MPRAFMITHKRRFEEGLAISALGSSLVAPTNNILSSHGNGGSAEYTCQLTSTTSTSITRVGLSGDSNGNMLHNNSIVACGGGGGGIGSGGGGVSSDDDGRRLQDSPRSESSLSTTPSSVLDSPPFKKREFFNRGGRLSDRKSISVSDGGESDSGCSSHNEARHDPPPEVDYGLDCPSGLSILLELMTQSPQRYMGRDAAAEHIHLAEVAKMTGKGVGMVAGKDFEQSAATLLGDGPVDKAENKIADFLHGDRQRAEVSPIVASLVSPVMSGHEDKTISYAKQSTIKDLSISANAKNATARESSCEAGAHVDNASNYPFDLIHGASVLYDMSAFHIQRGERGIHATQRKIAFDERCAWETLHSGAEKDYHVSRPLSPVEQPIDYSQLSSRSKERNEVSENSPDCASQKRSPSPGSFNGEDRKLVKRIIKDSPTAENEIENMVTSPKYEFILSPKMDRNGNLILNQGSPLQCSRNIGEEGLEKKHSTLSQAAGVGFFNTSNVALGKYMHHTGGVEEQGSPRSVFPVSQVQVSGRYMDGSDDKQNYESDASASALETSQTSQARSNTVQRSKSLGVYHPKLKYLLAASQYAKQKAEEEEASMQSHHFGSNVSSIQAQNQIDPRRFSKTHRFRNSPEALQEMSQSQRHTSRNSQDSNHLLPQRNDQCLARTTSMSTLSSHAPSIHSHPRGTSDAGVASPGNVFIHSHYTHRQSQQQLFQFEFPSSPAIFSDFQISKLHTGSDHSLLRQLEPKTTTSSFSSLSPSSASSHHGKHQQADITEILYTGRSPISSSSPSSSSPPSPISASAQSFKSGLDPYECGECGKRYSTSSNLARHRQTHRSVCDKKARKCPHCDKVYVSMPAYSMHVRTHNQGCQCPHCGKKFSRPWLLQGHIRTHTGEKPFACNQCGKSFADKSNLRAHIQTHSTEKPYVCGRCGKAFALKSYLYKHEESSCMRGQRFSRR